MTKYIEAVSSLEDIQGPSVFLAGGITGCEDWQQRLARKLYSAGFPGTILNPRREDFPIEDPNAAKEQIAWEFNALKRADLISFWFSSETIQPIVLYELGRWLHSDKPVVIGAHKDYPRLQDVVIQTELARPDTPIVPTIDDLVTRIMGVLKSDRRLWG